MKQNIVIWERSPGTRRKGRSDSCIWVLVAHMAEPGPLPAALLGPDHIVIAEERRLFQALGLPKPVVEVRSLPMGLLSCIELGYLNLFCVKRFNKSCETGPFPRY